MRAGSFGSHEAYPQIPAPCPFANPRDELPPVHVRHTVSRRLLPSRINAYIFERNNPFPTTACAGCDSAPPPAAQAARHRRRQPMRPAHRTTRPRSGARPPLRARRSRPGWPTETLKPSSRLRYKPVASRSLPKRTRWPRLRSCRSCRRPGINDLDVDVLEVPHVARRYRHVAGMGDRRDLAVGRCDGAAG